MYEIIEPNFDIHKICYSGQCFRMREKEDCYAVVAYGKYVEIRQQQDQIQFSCTKEEFDTIWYDYFDLSKDYDTFIHLVPDTDEYMQSAIRFGYGIRILKQDVWEMIISFIISQANNIPRIRTSIQTICERYGEKKETNGISYHTFPSPEVLSNVSDLELRSCNVGFRSKYILRAAQIIASSEVSLSNLKKMSYEDAKETLMTFPGIGKKVADCVCLYGLHHYDAFPIDTHIKKVLEEGYPHGFPFEAYKGALGPLQQYAFYYDLYYK